MILPVDAKASAPPRADGSFGLDEEWDAAFSWSYGQGMWNVGCG